MHFVFSAFISRPTSALACKSVSEFSLWYLSYRPTN